jgi:hypothetical protein
MKRARSEARAAQAVAALEVQRAELAARIQSDLAAVGAARDPKTELLEPVTVRPRKTDVQVSAIALAWMPSAGAVK